MTQSELAKYKARVARAGGLARAKKLTPGRIKEIAIKASKAAAKARTRKAKERRRVRESEE
jgi:hypothetical protein